MTDVTKETVSLRLVGEVGWITIERGQLQTVERLSYPPALRVATGVGSFRIEDKPGLYTELLRIMANCAEYADAENELDATTEARIQ